MHQTIFVYVLANYPIREGMVASLGPFIDTIVICTATAFVILLSGNFGTQMYQQTGKSVLLDSSEIKIESGWQLVSQEIPEENEVLRRFREGEKALYYQSANTHQAIKVNINPHLADGIRFSYYKKAGEMQIQLFEKLHQETEDGKKETHLKKLGKLTLAAGKDKMTFSSDFEVQALGYQSNEAWKSCILKFSSNFKKHLKEEKKELQIHFLPQGEKAEWFLDNIHPVKKAEGIALSIASFDKFLKGFGTVFITIAALLFAFSTMITWEYYGETGAKFLLGSYVVLPYRWLFIILAFVGAVVELGLIVNFSDAMVGLLVIPNAIAILLLSGNVVTWTNEYITDLKSGKFKPYNKNS